MTGSHWMMILLACTTTLTAAAAAPGKPKSATPVIEDKSDVPSAAEFPAQLDPAAFEARVREHGGRVDFIFEDDRPFAQCHASTVVETASGSLLSAWFGGTKEKDPDVAIWWSAFTDGKWAPPTCAAKVSQTAHWNPVLFRDANNALYLFFKVGESVSNWATYWRKSTDGVLWTEPVELVPGDIGGRGPVKDKPIILADGAWLAPASTECPGWKPFADRSEDNGLTWTRSEDFPLDRKIIPGSGAIQPTFWESQPGTVHALLRTAAGCIARTDSTDSGRTWSPIYRTDLPNNNSGIDALRLEDGRILLVFNPVKGNWGSRTPLYLSVSSDNGKTWTHLAALEAINGEFSYPAIVRTKTGVAITYTWKRDRVRCWQVPLEAL